MKLNLGCGIHLKKGFINIDIDKRVDPKYPFKRLDLNKSLPFKDNSVDYIYTNHALEHIDNLWQLVHEMYRVCKNKAILEIYVLHFTSIGNFFEFHVRQCRYMFLWEFCSDTAKIANKRFFKVIERKIKFKSIYSFMNFINVSAVLCRLWESTFLRSFIFAHEVKLLLVVQK